MFWTLYTLSFASVVAFGAGRFCLLEPKLVVAVCRRQCDRSRQFWRTPAILDESEARMWGVMAVVLAVILAGPTLVDV